MTVYDSLLLTQLCVTHMFSKPLLDRAFVHQISKNWKVFDLFLFYQARVRF